MQALSVKRIRDETAPSLEIGFMSDQDQMELATSLTRAERRNLVSVPDSLSGQIAELETENLRLQRLVAELLLKNQKLRGAPE